MCYKVVFTMCATNKRLFSYGVQSEQDHQMHQVCSAAKKAVIPANSTCWNSSAGSSIEGLSCLVHVSHSLWFCFTCRAAMLLFVLVVI